MTLRDISCGGSAEVISIEGGGAVRKRMMDMGITAGTVIDVKKAAPLGDPVEIDLRGYTICIRKQDAANIVVKKLS